MPATTTRPSAAPVVCRTSSGADSLYVELQDHGIDAQRDCNPQLLKIAHDLGAPLLATNDLHYTHQDDALAHDALLCVQTGALRSDPDRFKFHGDQHYLKSAAEMRTLFGEHREACDNTLAIAERAKVNIEFGRMLLPHFEVPAPHTDADAYLAHLAFEGAKRRWGTNVAQSTAERIAYELKVISDMGFSSYFLITWDLIRHARDSEIRVGPGRGSACRLRRCLLLGHHRSRPDPLRPAVRAIPEPGPHLDARHRHRLRRSLPRRDDPLHGPEVRP